MGGEVPSTQPEASGPQATPSPQPEPPKKGHLRIRMSLQRKTVRAGIVHQCVAIPEDLHREAALYVVANQLAGKEPSEFSGLVEKGISGVLKEDPLTSEDREGARAAIEEADRSRSEKKKAP